MTQVELEQENAAAEAVVAWRFEQLAEAGYTLTEATALAYSRNVDLHDAVDLVARGCRHELAVAILL